MTDSFNLKAIHEITFKIVSKNWDFHWSDNLHTRKRLTKEIEVEVEKLNTIISGMTAQGKSVVEQYARNIMRVLKANE